MNKELKSEINIIINYFNVGNYNKVLELCKKILKYSPENDFILNIVGLSYQKISQLDNAENFFIRAINVNKNNINALTNIANNYKYLLNYNKAEEFYLKALKINPNHLTSLLNYGNLKYLINQDDNSLELLKKAEKINNKLIPVQLNLAIVCQSIGDFKKALFHLDQINSLDKTFTRADKMKSVLIDYKENQDHLDQMLIKLKELKLDFNQKIYLYFGISKAYEDIGNYENSLKFIKLGNEIKYKNTNYNLENERNKIKSIKKIFQNYKFNKENILKNNNNPIFIIGMPRSGTSLVEQIISSHNQVEGLGELNIFNNIANDEFNKKNIYQNYNLNESETRIITERYLNILKSYKINNKYFSDKTLLNYKWIGIINLCFPNAKIIHCLRNPKDNLLSIFKNLFDHEGGWCYDEKILVQYYKDYLNIVNFWKTILPNYIHEIKYEDLIEKPEEIIRGMLDFCNLEWDQNCLNFNKNKSSIKTLSVKQARSKIYKTSVNSFKNYEKISKELFKDL